MKKVEDLVRLAAKPIAYVGYAFVLIGTVYLGLQLKGISRGGELRKALAMIAAGGVVVAFAACYGFAGF